jgi:subtilisin family serine protease
MLGAAFEADLAELVRDNLVPGHGRPRTGRPAHVPDVLLLNLAGTTRGDAPPVALSALYDDVLQHLNELVVVAPAGNEGDRRKNWPASFAWVVGVGALAANWSDRASWSNHGRNVDVFAPGEDIVNAYAHGDYRYAWDSPLRGTTATFDGMARWSGTSFAGPLVAGLIASRVSTTGQNSRRAWESLLTLAEGQAVAGVGPVLYPGQGSR